MNLKFSQSCSEELCITCPNTAMFSDAIHCTPSVGVQQNPSERSQRCADSLSAGERPRKCPVHSPQGASGLFVFGVSRRNVI